MARICKFGEDIFHDEVIFMSWTSSTGPLFKYSSLSDEQKCYLCGYIKNINLILNEFIKHKREFEILSYLPFWYTDKDLLDRANQLYLIIYFIIDDKRLESIYKRNSGLLHYFPLKAKLYISLVIQKYLNLYLGDLSPSELSFYESFWGDMEERRSKKWDR